MLFYAVLKFVDHALFYMSPVNNKASFHSLQCDYFHRI